MTRGARPGMHRSRRLTRLPPEGSMTVRRRAAAPAAAPCDRTSRDDRIVCIDTRRSASSFRSSPRAVRTATWRHLTIRRSRQECAPPNSRVHGTERSRRRYCGPSSALMLRDRPVIHVHGSVAEARGYVSGEPFTRGAGPGVAIANARTDIEDHTHGSARSASSSRSQAPGGGQPTKRQTRRMTRNLSIRALPRVSTLRAAVAIRI